MAGYVDAGTVPAVRSGAIKLHGPGAFAGMRRAGRLAADMLNRLAPHVVPGVTTATLDAIVHDMASEAGAVPASLGYNGYTHSCCISINHVVCHGIPSDRVLKEGEIVNIDVTPRSRPSVVGYSETIFAHA